MNHYITGFLSCLALSWVQKCQLFHFEGFFRKQERIPVECVPPASVAATRCQYWGGFGTIAYPEEGCVYGVCLGGVCLGGVQGVCSGGVPCHLSHHAFDVTCMLSLHQLRGSNNAAAYILLVGHVTCARHAGIHSPCGQTPVKTLPCVVVCENNSFLHFKHNVVNYTRTYITGFVYFRTLLIDLWLAQI